jgi:hypothetical protein
MAACQRPSFSREGAADHPIRTKAEDRLRAVADPRPSAAPGCAADGGAEGSPRAYADDQWRRLAERCLRGPQTIILESGFLQNGDAGLQGQDAVVRRRGSG